MNQLTLVAGLGDVLSSGPSALLGIFRPPYFFQYIQQETHRRHCMFGGPHEYHCADCMAVNVQDTLLSKNHWREKTDLQTLGVLISHTDSSLSNRHFIIVQLDRVRELANN